MERTYEYAVTGTTAERDALLARVDELTEALRKAEEALTFHHQSEPLQCALPYGKCSCSALPVVRAALARAADVDGDERCGTCGSGPDDPPNVECPECLGIVPPTAAVDGDER